MASHSSATFWLGELCRFVEGTFLIKDYTKLKKAIRDSGIKPGKNLTKSYRDVLKAHPSWPSNPQQMRNWVSWSDLCGKVEKLKILSLSNKLFVN